VRRLLLVAVLITLCSSLSAQVVSRLGRFSVDKVQGCAPFTVTILETDLSPSGADCTPGTPCAMFYHGGTVCAPNSTPCQNLTSYTYETPGTFTLSVVYQNIGADDIVITVDENIEPDFEVYRCSNNDVTIKVEDNNYEQYVIDFSDGPEVAIPFSNNMLVQHDYTTAGTYNIKVRGRDSNPDAADNCDAKETPVVTLTTLPGVSLTSLTATSPTSVQLAATTQPHILYRLEIAVNNGSTFQLLQSVKVYETSTIDLSNLLLDNNYYCFRLSSYDPCTNSNSYSNIVCSQDFDVAFNNGVNELTWRTATFGMTGFSWQRTDMTEPQSFGHSEPGVHLSDSDVDYDCNHHYCYQLTITYAGGATSTSLSKCGVGQLLTTHPAVDNVTGSINPGGTADLTWTLDPLLKLQGSEIMRSSNGGPFTQVGTTTGSAVTFNDGTYTTEGAYCYQVNYLDLCQNYSAAGVIVCPMRLLGSMNASNVVTLNWTPYKGWKDGVQSYVVEKYTPTGALITSFPVNLDTFLVDDLPDLANQIVLYKVRSVPVTGTTGAYSNTLTFTKSVNLTFPTAFTPNADALNDVFHVTGQYVSKMNIRIFDRWGSLVFASESNEPWNGTREGVPMAESAYVWRAEVTDLAGQTTSREGTVVLIRN
jgi:gliding motility-associated-like protein